MKSRASSSPRSSPAGLHTPKKAARTFAGTPSKSRASGLGKDRKALNAERQALLTARRGLVAEIREQSKEVKRTCENVYREMARRSQVEAGFFDELRGEIARRGLFEQEMRERTESFQSLSANLMLVEQRDRKRLAEVLHDDVMQMLAAVKFRLASLLGAETSPEMAAQVENLLNQCLATTRALMSDLSPPMLKGDTLETLVRGLARWMENTEGLHVQVTFEPSGSESEPTRLLLFHTIRELLSNVVRHAETKEAEIQVTYSRDAVQVIVTDRGRGFDAGKRWPAEERNGLAAIRQRIESITGRMEVSSAPGKGSRVIIQAPLHWSAK